MPLCIGTFREYANMCAHTCTHRSQFHSIGFDLLCFGFEFRHLLFYNGSLGACTIPPRSTKKKTKEIVMEWNDGKRRSGTEESKRMHIYKQHFCQFNCNHVLFSTSDFLSLLFPSLFHFLLFPSVRFAFCSPIRSISARLALNSPELVFRNLRL